MDAGYTRFSLSYHQDIVGLHWEKLKQNKTKNKQTNQNRKQNKTSPLILIHFFVLRLRISFQTQNSLPIPDLIPLKPCKRTVNDCVYHSLVSAKLKAQRIVSNDHKKDLFIWLIWKASESIQSFLQSVVFFIQNVKFFPKTT